MLTGKIKAGTSTEKELQGWWSAECELIGAWTQGHDREDAIDALRSLVEIKVKDAVPSAKGFKATVTDLRATEIDGSVRVVIDSNHPGALAAAVLKQQRQTRGLTLTDVAKRLGSSSHNAYAAYERGAREPSLSKYRELLHAVAPELGFSIGELDRKPAKSIPAKRPSKALGRRKAH